MSCKCYTAPDGKEYCVPSDAPKEEFIGIWNEIFGSIQSYNYDKCHIEIGDVVLDCGANIGLFTIMALQAGAKHIHAFEPNEDNYRCLYENTRPYILQTEIYKVALYSHNNGMKFHVDTDRLGSHFISDVHPYWAKENDLVVPTVTIDWLGFFMNDAVDFIKMDIEGSEPEAIRGAEKTITRFKPRMVIATYHKSGQTEEIERLLKSYRNDYQIQYVDLGEYDKFLVCW